uniref:DUF3727 domain-containing protein n=1 Tax=Paulinella chromatophora TaxID=39717 RepID=B1X3P5_PAUCH|nr:hypothetical protein PCC_0112 [Paulinella chromatophora]ACB42564.1 hypothetical protein PCC_0112 [Paulinella chromatophora]|eukprot:gb/GEZN01008609.1/.p1 GENE.gb/GEZN01008609.1/~~gb/GEZN01008609.1/.p1  ORF type:complete len:198 (-),score=8.52 gb/GEZN01008609.1/:317-910(-)
MHLNSDSFFMDKESSSSIFDMNTVVVSDSQGRELLCFLEHRIPFEDESYALLTPVNTPVCLFLFKEEDDPELIDTLNHSKYSQAMLAPILSIADVVLSEHDLTLIRSAVSLTVKGELDDRDRDDLEEDTDAEDEAETYELLVSFMVGADEYGLYIPLDPFFIVARLENTIAHLVEGEEFDLVQPRIEAELAERGLFN